MLPYDIVLNIIKYLDLESFLSLCICNVEYSYLYHDTFILNYWKCLFSNIYYVPDVCSYKNLLALSDHYTVPPPLYRSYDDPVYLYIDKDRSITNLPVHIGSLGCFEADRAEDTWLNFIVVKKYCPGDDYLEVIYPVFYDHDNEYVLGSDISSIDSSHYDPVYKYLSHSTICKDKYSDSLQCGCEAIQRYRYPSFKSAPSNNLYKICRIDMKCQKVYTTYLRISNNISSKPYNDICHNILRDSGLYNC